MAGVYGPSIADLASGEHDRRRRAMSKIRTLTIIGHPIRVCKFGTLLPTVESSRSKRANRPPFKNPGSTTGKGCTILQAHAVYLMVDLAPTTRLGMWSPHSTFTYALERATDSSSL